MRTAVTLEGHGYTIGINAIIAIIAIIARGVELAADILTVYSEWES